MDGPCLSWRMNAGHGRRRGHLCGGGRRRQEAGEHLRRARRLPWAGHRRVPAQGGRTPLTLSPLPVVLSEDRIRAQGFAHSLVRTSTQTSPIQENSLPVILDSCVGAQGLPHSHLPYINSAESQVHACRQGASPAAALLRAGAAGLRKDAGPQGVAAAEDEAEGGGLREGLRGQPGEQVDQLPAPAQALRP